MQDASFLLRVPLTVPDVPALEYEPVILYMADGFKKPLPFKPDVVIDTEEYLDEKAKMLYCHESQFFEWLPWLDGELDQVPKDEKGRLQWCRQWLLNRSKNLMNPEIMKTYQKIYGDKAKEKLISFEAFEVSEYGAYVTQEELCEIFELP